MAKQASPKVVTLAARTVVLNVPYTEGNPYQQMLYGSASGSAVPAPGRKDFADLGKHAAQAAGAVFHLHWDDRIFGRTSDRDKNRKHADVLLRRLEAFRAAGGRVLWTIHNRRPHNEIDGDTFEYARRRLCGIADIIHVHAPHAATHMVEDWGAAPEKIRIIRHPSYLGVYEPEDMTLARPFPESERRRLLVFGMMRGNKGLDMLERAVERLGSQRQDFTLDLVGKGFSGQADMFARFSAIPGVTVNSERVPDEDLPGIFGQAQVFVAPSASVFSSGSIVLAQSFGLPVVAPNTEALRQITPKACWDLLYEGQRPRDLIRALRAVIDMPDEVLREKRAACLDLARETSPGRQSHLVQELLAGFANQHGA